MKIRFDVYIVACLCFVLIFGLCGCRPKTKGTIAALTDEAGVEADKSQRQKEVFDREIERLNSMEDAPSLPGTPGGERLVQAADRLNKWIQDRAADELWKPEESFQLLETKTAKTAKTAKELERLLLLLQGQDVFDEDEKPIKASENLDLERKQAVEKLAALDADLKSLAVEVGIPDIAIFSNQVTELQKKFAGLDSIKNLTASRIRNFSMQLDADTKRFAAVAEALDRFASELKIEGLFIHPADVDFLKQCTWMRDISRWACGDRQDALERAKNLFDWTVCNIDLKDPANPFGIDSLQGQLELRLQYPWQSLVLGFGTVWDRTWVFIELLRQQKIDACLLSTPLPDQVVQQNGEPRTIPGSQLIWAVGVFIDNELYLFLPMYGLALPGPKGCKFAENGTLDYEDVATLSQILKDEKLLRQLDLSDENKFPITMEMLQKTTVLLVAPPESVSLRMKVLETELSGEQNMVLYTNIAEQKRRLSELDSLNSIELWKYPFRAKFEQILLARMTTELMAPFQIPNPKRNDFPLWAGRILYFQGKITGQEGAMMNYQRARIPDREIMEYRNHAEFRNNPLQETWYRIVSMYASFWLGTASLEVDSIPAAKDFFNTLDIGTRQNIWHAAVKYMLGRVSELEKNYDEACRHYEQATGSPSSNGNLLRAKWLRQLQNSR